MTPSLAEYKATERKIRDADEQHSEWFRTSVLARWSFGKMVLSERRGAGRLPNKRREQIAEACKISASEIAKRTKLAETYETEAELCNELHSWNTWMEFSASLYGENTATEGGESGRSEPNPWDQVKDGFTLTAKGLAALMVTRPNVAKFAEDFSALQMRWCKVLANTDAAPNLRIAE